jgi:putative nucleotidyltransferase with HDIG domain
MEPARPRRASYKDRSAPDPTASGTGVDRRAEERWDRRRTAAIGVRAAIVGGPIAGSVAAMAVLSRVLPSPGAPGGVLPRVAWWVAILAGSLAAMWLVDRATRRLAPLAALLDMAVLFPGHAPTRFKVARKAGDLRQLTALTAQANKLDGRSGLADAAEKILALVGSLRAHDRHTRGHSERVRVYTDLIAAQMRLTPAAVDRLRWAALLHDIGKLRVPRTTLNKPAKLSAAEWEIIRQHPLAGADLAGALLPWLGEWGKAIAEHHERFDGTGYPLGLSGREISLAGRIVALADSFEVMTAARAYKKAMTRGAALAEVVKCSGTQFDPEVVRALLEVSAPRLRWAMGPTSWLVGTPLLGSAPSLTAAGVAAQAAVGVSAVAVAGVTGVAGPALAANSTPAPAPSAQPAAATHVAVAPAHPATPVAPRVATKHSAPRPAEIPAPPVASAPSGPPTPVPPPPAQPPKPAIIAPAPSAKATATAPAKKSAAPKPTPSASPKATAPSGPVAPPAPKLVPLPRPLPLPPPPPSAPSPTSTSNSGKGSGNHGHGHGWGHGSGG